MARLRISATDASTVPTPPAGKSTMFLDAADLSFKAKLPDGSLIPISATEEYIQDVVGQFFQDSSTIDIIYNDAGDVISVEVIESGLDVFQIPVTPTGNLSSDNLGDALNELQSSIDDSNDALQAHLDDDTDAHDSSAVSFDSSSNTLTTNNAQEAIEEVNTKLDTHLDGDPNKHDANEVDYERANVNKNDIQNTTVEVETALSDLDDNKLSRTGNQAMTGNLNMNNNNIVTGATGLVDGRDVSVDGAKLDTIESNAKDDQVASEVPLTSTGNLSSNNVQDGLEELQDDIDTINTEFEERAQDAIGAILEDTSTVELNYNDSTNEITAVVPNAGITNAQIASGIDAAKIADGTVSNTEFQRLAGITSNIQTQLNSKLNLSGGTMTGDLFLNADPTMDLQAATKRYVDNAIQGLNAKDSVKFATTSAGNLASDFEDGDIVDGTALSTGDRILIKNQADLSENGIYIVQASGAPLRSDDADTFDELVGAFIFVEEGVTLANTGWTCTASAGGVLETDALPWVQFSSAGIITVDGEGLEKTGNDISLELDGGTLSKSGTGLKVADSGIDTAQINNLSVTNAKIANTTITNAKISAAAAIEFSKLETLLSNRVLITNGSGVVTASVITQTELEYLDNTTSNIQNQLNNKTPISHIDGGPNKHDATEVDYEVPDGQKTDVEATSDNIELAVGDLDDNKLSINGNNSMSADLNMDNNNIVTGTGLVDGRNVSADGSKLDTIESGATADQVASEVPLTPSGTVSSTNVQDGIAELDNEKVPKTTTVNAGTGLSGGGDLSANRTISMPNVGTAGTYGSATQVPVVTTDAQGRVSGVVNTAIDGVPAANIVNTPAGNISSTNTQAAINELDAEKQPLDSDLTAVANLAGTGFITRTGTGTATTRTLQGTAGNIDVSNGDGLSGNPTINLPDVGSASNVGSASQSVTITTDGKGRVTNKVAQAISIVSSQVTDFASSVRSVLLTGYVVGSNTILTATDSILQAFQKIQGQINERVSGPASSTDNAITRYDGVTGKNVQNSSASINDNGGIIAGDFVRPGNTSDTTNANIRYNTNELHGRVNGVWRNLGVVPNTISATGDTSTTSGTYGVISSMTTTPTAGTYMVIFECSAHLGDDTSADIGIFLAGTEQTIHTKTLEIQSNGGFGPTGEYEVPVTIIAFLTVNGSQAIDIRFRENGGGTLTIGPRLITTIPIAR